MAWIARRAECCVSIIDSCYFQCSKAGLPSAGDIFRCIVDEFDVEAYERDMWQRLRTTLY
ncbi:hypothetical protein JF55_22505 [Pseudomonas sp. 1-7]|jgi:hypothetical protein|nr:hypothetical protein JF55_22505 [Pseudomonas sp. 1-7]